MDDTRPVGRKILVVEDEFLIALHVENLIETIGHKTIGPAASIKMANRYLLNETPCAALIDLKLLDEFSTPLARRLRQARIPFAVMSAYATLPDACLELSDVPRLEKPVLRAHLERTINTLLQ
ncbi:response regulator [Fodinicurvata sp. EGI_FJ10296]|uniref:response regulator n=1 Tax=Fodinicurvata sp. EGI_FJ10296 TaxID=3231908 RepID=UPI0034539AA8